MSARRWKLRPTPLLKSTATGASFRRTKLRKGSSATRDSGAAKQSVYTYSKISKEPEARLLFERRRQISPTPPCPCAAPEKAIEPRFSGCRVRRSAFRPLRRDSAGTALLVVHQPLHGEPAKPASRSPAVASGNSGAVNHGKRCGSARGPARPPPHRMAAVRLREVRCGLPRRPGHSAR